MIDSSRITGFAISPNICFISENDWEDVMGALNSTVLKNSAPDWIGPSSSRKCGTVRRSRLSSLIGSRCFTGKLASFQWRRKVCPLLQPQYSKNNAFFFYASKKRIIDHHSRPSFCLHGCSLPPSERVNYTSSGGFPGLEDLAALIWSLYVLSLLNLFFFNILRQNVVLECMVDTIPLLHAVIRCPSEIVWVANRSHSPGP